MKNIRFLMLGAMFLFPSVLSYASGKSYILIDKTKLMLYVIADADTLFAAPVCIGKNLGDKIEKGDCRTPEGELTICRIQDAQLWKHDFKDGKGMIADAYGPLFFRLKTPIWKSIGIHGTCYPETIGTRDSEGCIRLTNDKILELYKFVSIGMKVIILPDN